MPGDGQGKTALGFIPGQTGSRVEDALKVLSLWQVVGAVAGQLAGDAFELLAAGKFVVQDHEELLQLDGDVSPPAKARR